MKRLFIICCCLWWGLSNAQNSAIFIGGAGDGAGRQNYLQNSQNHWLGGDGDGWHYANYVQQTQNHWLGGDGDGWHYANYVQNSITFWKGGDGDGWARDSVIQNSINLWKGGDGDGWASTYIPLSSLPVNMLYFTGHQANRQHFLKWATSSETNTDHFTVERSANNINYSTLGNVMAAGYSTVPKQYNLADATPLTGNNFYRLKMFDRDGQFRYSNIVLLKLLKDRTSVSIFPNPTASMLNIQLSGDADGSEVAIDIFDAQGKLLRNSRLKKDNLSVQVDVSAYPAGTYTLYLSNATEKTSVRFVKQ